MRAEALPQLAIGLLVAAAIAAGLWVVGGPEQGRLEKRDARRLDDLRSLRGFVICVAEKSGRQLPLTLTPHPECDPLTGFEDPFTGAPYVYEKLATDRFRLCATFEDPEAVARINWPHERFDPDTGCLLNGYTRR